MKSTRVVSGFAVAASVACLALPATACSFLFVHGPPLGHERMEYFTCTEEGTVPTIDAILAGLTVVGSVLIAADPNAAARMGDAAYSSGTYLAVGLAEGAAFGVAAGVGFRKTRDCQAARRQWLERQRQGQPARAGPQPDSAGASAPTSRTTAAASWSSRGCR